MVRLRLLLLCLGGALVLTACEAFRAGSDPLAQPNPKGMAPYMGRPSGAVRLGLQLYNGCGVLGNGTSTGPGRPNFSYPYPSTCVDLNGRPSPASALAPLPVVAGTHYFLDQITVADVVTGLHTDPRRLDLVLNWFKTSTHFKNLDWRNVAINADEWEGDRAVLGGFTRELRFAGANWMNEEGTFTLELLDTDGTVQATEVIPLASFTLETPTAGHIQFSLRYGTVGRPEYLGDERVNPVPAQPVGGASVRPPSFRTMARLDLEGQGDPFRYAFTIPEGLTGDGAMRVTWSQLPSEPFYFPVSFKSQSDPSFPQCWDANDPSQRVPCDFGVDPEVSFTMPRNGRFFEAGERLEMLVQVKDGLGNLLHPPDALPSYNDFLAGRSNGILYQYSSHNGTFGERAVWSSMSVQGPIQEMRLPYVLEGFSPWFSQFGRGSLPNAAAPNNSATGARDVPGETRWPIQLPEDAHSGTYIAIVKINRQFMGERIARTNTFYFQVGQAERTNYPQRIGNCEICHFNALNLRNIAMGMPAKDVEACKSCHGSTTGRFIHQIHMHSNHYPLRKNDCTVCHLTREAPLRASLLVCTSCHQQAHAAQFFDEFFTSGNTSADPNLMGACSPNCHAMTPPTQHILPLK